MGRKALLARAGVAVVALASVTAAMAGSPASAADTVKQTILVPSSDTHLVVTYRGNGHGHGLSQYGALGAAKEGLKYPAILFFYYPRTVLKQAPAAAKIRVRLSNTGTATTVAARRHLAVTGVEGELPTRGIAKYRLIANGGSRLTLQKLAASSDATWQTVAQRLPNKAAFHRTNGFSTRLYLADGTTTGYYGALRAVRVSDSGTSGGVFTVNRVSYDQYTQGVVPKEMPSTREPTRCSVARPFAPSPRPRDRRNACKARS